MGYLEVICGSMFSGKSEELIRRVRRWMIAKKRVLVFKPSIDTRYGTNVTSHDGNNVEAQMVLGEYPAVILNMAIEQQAQVVAIDEAQFFSAELLEIIDELIKRDVRVICAGLDMDFARRPFGIMPTLMAVADEVTKLKAICQVCGEPATFNQRLIDGRPASRKDPIIVVGGRETYEARCRKCHVLPD